MPLPPRGTSLYFIALIPPSPLLEEAQGFKEYFRDRYNSRASLNSPPHITLHMPFQWKETREEKLITTLNAFSAGKTPFTISFNNFACFAPRVIYIDVHHSESLQTLQHDLHRLFKVELNVFNAQYRDLPFHPHLTLAFRDLKKDQFAQAWQEFEQRKFSGDFSITKITLLKHDGKLWQRFCNFDF